MFTGIVEEVGSVAGASNTGLTISASTVMDDLKVSDSISVNGACLTVTDRSDSSFSVDTVPETLRRTNLGALKEGDFVNLERPMATDGRFGGHIVQGHIDGTGRVLSVEQEGGARNFKFEADDSIMRYVVEKGFVAVDGTSLTVVDCDYRTFSVTIVPYTWENTIFGTLKLGDPVNLEVDIIAKYVERLAAGPRLPVDTADEL
ncbi:MAG: riboflavin synthase [Dehalococcoidia bacterium]|nr:riboflavin synthase [Dehalococcoidia bacterium]